MMDRSCTMLSLRMAERPELRLVREHLETVLSPSVAASALFEALGAVSMPVSARETAALVTGPLRSVLASRLRQGEADGLIEDVLVALAPALDGERAHHMQPRGDATLEVPISGAGEAVRLAVMGASEIVAQQIEGALGPMRVSAVTLRTAIGLERACTVPVTTPEIVLIDASRFPAIEPHELAQALAGLPETAVRVIWGADLPYGAALMRDILARGGTATSVDRKEGVEPILDLVRSRSGRPTLPPKA